MERDSAQLEAALDLLRRLPPHRVERNLAHVVRLLPHFAKELLCTVDPPTRVRSCPVSSRDFLSCEYNCADGAFRSPWSNEYCRPSEDSLSLSPVGNSEELPHASLPRSSLSPPLRMIESVANEAFDTYRSLYYDGGISSVYLWDSFPGGPPCDTSSDDNNGGGIGSFMAAVLIKKECEASEILRGGAWDSIHVFEAVLASGGGGGEKRYDYKLTTTVILHLDAVIPAVDALTLSGQLTRQTAQGGVVIRAGGEAAVLQEAVEHVVAMGRMVEESESRMRSSLQEVYFGKTHDVINEIRPIVPAGYLRHQADLQREMAKRLNRSAVAESSGEA